MPKVVIKKNIMNRENDSILYRRLPTSGFRRDNTVRSSLRMLSNRWKQSTKATLIKNDETRSSELILPSDKWCEDSSTKLKPLTNTDDFIKPKSEIKLELPMNNDLFNQRTSMFLMNSNLNLLKRSKSLKNYGHNDEKRVQRTATIRKGSVWANSTSSKIICFSFYYFVCYFLPSFFSLLKEPFQFYVNP